MIKLLIILAPLLIQGLPTLEPRIGQLGGISGVVLKRSGIPAANLRIAALDVGSANAGNISLVGITQTDSTGRYRLQELPAGRYAIVAGQLANPTFYPAVEAREKASIVIVESGKVLDGIDFKVDLARVEGKIMGEDGSAPPSGSKVQLLTTGDRPIPALEANCRADGSFVFPEVPPANYNVIIHLHSHRLAGIQVADQDISGLNLVIPSNVEGRVLMVDNGQLPRVVTLQYVRSGCSSLEPGPCTQALSSVVQSNGDFKVWIPEGWGTVGTISPLPEGYSLASLAYGGIDLLVERRAQKLPISNAKLLITLSPQKR